MKEKTKNTIEVIAMAMARIILYSLLVVLLFDRCSSDQAIKEDRMECYGNNTNYLIPNDDLKIIPSKNGLVSIKNIETGKTVLKNIKLEENQFSRKDSLVPFCTEMGQYGFFSIFTGRDVIKAQYKYVLPFSEGLAGVVRNGLIGFINKNGEMVIDFRYEYDCEDDAFLYKNIFKDGCCIVLDTSGMYGIINRLGEWMVEPEYNDVSYCEGEYFIASKTGKNIQITPEGDILNTFILDNIEELTFSDEEKYYDREGNLCFTEHEVKTGYFSYEKGGRCGLMKNNQCLTEPIYDNIRALNSTTFLATLLDGDFEVILNSNGQVIKE